MLMSLPMSSKDRAFVAFSTIILFLFTVIAISQRFDNSLIAIGLILVMTLFVGSIITNCITRTDLRRSPAVYFAIGSIVVALVLPFMSFSGAYLIGFGLIAFSCVACTPKLQRAVNTRA